MKTLDILSIDIKFQRVLCSKSLCRILVRSDESAGEYYFFSVASRIFSIKVTEADSGMSLDCTRLVEADSYERIHSCLVEGHIERRILLELLHIFSNCTVSNLLSLCCSSCLCKCTLKCSKPDLRNIPAHLEVDRNEAIVAGHSDTEFHLILLCPVSREDDPVISCIICGIPAQHLELHLKRAGRKLDDSLPQLTIDRCD